ncbi:hypothetical protein BJI67_13635 [Acidihalobacter aeolianus]|uniref:Uncharacterized protein n=1 Tax=Acidihalobacter aeolianus TaxID=2792603 RepID=A0A1D8KAI8_9GAMM|nr:hypothetical protein [Acidihalobacter aeolianus]AOV17961.1 hypothetical protein BJI67_13635 [Acidihalobacter aeolianus]
MNVTRPDDTHLTLEIDLSNAEKLCHGITKHAVDLTNGCLEVASLLQVACYAAENTFRQPPHAFDAQHPRHPVSED